MVMPLRKQKRLLALTCTVLALAIVACLAAGALPVGIEQDDNASDPTGTDHATLYGTPTGPLADYAAIWGGNPRGSIYPPPPPPPPVARKKKPLTVRLTGTVVEPGFTYAILCGKSGQSKFVAIGQSLDGAEVVEVAADSATVRFDGESIVLKKTEATGSRR